MTYSDETWSYDVAGRPTGYNSGASSNPVIASSSYAVNSNGRLTSKTTRTGDTADSSRRQSVETYAESGAVKTVEDDACGDTACTSPNLSRSITATNTYDSLGRRASVTVHDTAAYAVDQTQSYEDNTAGNITKITYPDITTGTTHKCEAIQYDLTGKPVSHTYPDDQWFMYRYDVGQRLRKVDSIVFGAAINLATYAYNENGLRTSETLNSQNTGSRTYTIDPATGLTTKYVQNLANAVSWTTPITYDTAGRVKTDCKATGSGGACQASDVKTTYTYDDASQLTDATISNLDSASQTPAVVGDLLQWTYTYTNTGQRGTQAVKKITAVNTSPTPPTTTTTTTHYGYNDDRQLTCADSSSTSPACSSGNYATYTYDRAGRRTQVAVVGTGSYTQATTYDPRGLVADTTIGTTIIYRGYDPVGQLNCTASTGTSNSEGLKYCRRKDTSSSSSPPGSNANNQFNYWDTSGAAGGVPQSITAYNGTTSNYVLIYGGARMNVNGFNFGQNYQGSATQAFANGDAPTKYSPYGEPLNGNSATGHIPSRFEYRGEYYYDKTLYLRNRLYDPTTGSFLSRDPMDGVDGTTTVANPYHYADNDLLNRVDPMGLRSATDAALTQGSVGWNCSADNPLLHSNAGLQIACGKTPNAPPSVAPRSNIASITKAAAASMPQPSSLPSLGDILGSGLGAVANGASSLLNMYHAISPRHQGLCVSASATAGVVAQFGAGGSLCVIMGVANGVKAAYVLVGGGFATVGNVSGLGSLMTQMASALATGVFAMAGITLGYVYTNTDDPDLLAGASTCGNVGGGDGVFLQGELCVNNSSGPLTSNGLYTLYVGAGPGGGISAGFTQSNTFKVFRGMSVPSGLLSAAASVDECIPNPVGCALIHV